MVVVLIVLVFWAVCLLVVSALCAAARRGDGQLDPSREAALVMPAPGAREIAPEVSVVRVSADAGVDCSPRTDGDLALQSG